MRKLYGLFNWKNLHVVALISTGWPKSNRCDKDSSSDSANKKKYVFGLGAAGVDYLATVSAYPEADSKIRTTSLKMQGGGNCANTLTCISRLGMPTVILSKVGDDDHGTFVERGLRAEGVCTDLLVTVPGLLTGFVYVIVDQATHTRTCIATPVEKELTPDEVQLTLVTDGACRGRSETYSNSDAKFDLESASLLHLDSRHTEAAVASARLARSLDVPVTLDAEKDRPPHMADLLPLADILFTNESFAQSFRHSSKRNTETISQNDYTYTLSVDDTASVDPFAQELESLLTRVTAMERFLGNSDSSEDGKSQLSPPHTNAVVSTMGARGSILISRTHNTAKNNIISSRDNDWPEYIHKSRSSSWLIDPELLRTAPLTVRRYTLVKSRSQCSHSHTLGDSAVKDVDVNQGIYREEYSVLRCTAWPSEEVKVVDSTGAGDAFIGGFIAALLHGHTREECLKIGTAVAAEKLAVHGARDGLPNLLRLVGKFEASKSFTRS